MNACLKLNLEDCNIVGDMSSRRRRVREVDNEEEVAEPVVQSRKRKKKGKLDEGNDEGSGNILTTQPSNNENDVISSKDVFTLVVEHWASDLIAELKTVWPDLKATLNPTKPRRGSFEFTLTDGNGKDVLVWSGIKRGPPRKEKFPSGAELMEAVRAAL